MQYWCQVCDSNLVDSEKPETGTWHYVAGHDVRNPAEYVTIRFAICYQCGGKLENYSYVKPEMVK